MDITIESLNATHVAATTDDVRNWSNGSVKRRMQHGCSKDEWYETIGTLWDQRIFGCRTAFACACGRFFGGQYLRAVCDRCGVRVGTEKARWLRFSHINLTHPIAHPFRGDAATLEAIPIIPAAYWDQYGRERFSKAYEEIVRLVHADCTPEDLTGAFGVVIANIEALLDHLMDHETEMVETLAKGLVLKIPAEQVSQEIEAQLAHHNWDDLKLADD